MFFAELIKLVQLVELVRLTILVGPLHRSVLCIPPDHCEPEPNDIAPTKTRGKAREGKHNGIEQKANMRARKMKAKIAMLHTYVRIIMQSTLQRETLCKANPQESASGLRFIKWNSMEFYLHNSLPLLYHVLSVYTHNAYIFVPCIMYLLYTHNAYIFGVCFHTLTAVGCVCATTFDRL